MIPMKFIQVLFVPVMLLRPLSASRIDYLDTSAECLSNNSLKILTIDDTYEDLGITDRAIVVSIGNVNDSEKDLEENPETDVDFTSGFGDKIFPKTGASYSESSKNRGSHSSVIRDLHFRSKTQSRNGKESPPRGKSDPQHPVNIEQFKKMRIPIDPMRDPTEQPTKDGSWRWDKKEKRWKSKPLFKHATPATSSSSSSQRSKPYDGLRIVKSETVKFPYNKK